MTDSPPFRMSREGAASAPDEATDQQRHLRHALRTPLNQIIGYSEMLQEDAEARGLPEFVTDLKKIEHAGRRLLELIQSATESLVVPRNVPASTVSESSSRALDPAPALAAVSALLPAAGKASETHGDDTSSRHEPTPQAAVSGRILVVDDDALNRDLLTRRLKARSFQTDTAVNGREALFLIANERFDLVLLDVMMPDMSGIEVLGHLRRRFDAAELPVIMATAKDGSDDMVRALEAGANDYITKPLDMAVVLARVSTQLLLKGTRDRVRELDARLATAQERVGRMAGSASHGVDDVNAWSKEVTAEIGDAIGSHRVSMFLYERESLVCVA